MTARIIAFANQKGGALKTTLTAHMAHGLARFHKKRVLAIDLDPQGNLTMSMGKQGEAREGFDANSVLKAQRITQVTHVSACLDVIPSNINLAGADMGLSGEVDFQFLLRNALENPDGTNLDYDYILIDTPPTLSLLTINALVAADTVLIPLTCDGFGMSGVAALTRTIAKLQRLNPTLLIGGVIPCRYDQRRVIDRDMVRKMIESFHDLVYSHKVPESTALKECCPMGQIIWDYNPSALAAPVMEALCAEMLERIEHVEA